MPQVYLVHGSSSFSIHRIFTPSPLSYEDETDLTWKVLPAEQNLSIFCCFFQQAVLNRVRSLLSSSDSPEERSQPELLTADRTEQVSRFFGDRNKTFNSRAFLCLIFLGIPAREKRRDERPRSRDLRSVHKGPRNVFSQSFAGRSAGMFLCHFCSQLCTFFGFTPEEVLTLELTMDHFCLLLKESPFGRKSKSLPPIAWKGCYLHRAF